jgi:hypothetical protein
MAVLRLFFAVLAAALSLGLQAQPQAEPEAEPEPASVPEPLSLGGKLQLQWQRAAAGEGATALAELRGASRGWNALLTLQQAWQAQGDANGAWVNELAYSRNQGSWQYSVGKKVVSWDVGYAYRPNDLVQQEERSTLLEASPIGRPVVQAEYFASDAAWSLVAVNPDAGATARGADEAALAARYYQRQGRADWYAFARSARHSGQSLGAALAWVASDSLELHASLRTQPGADALALLGANWTNAQQLGLLLEAWRTASQSLSTAAQQSVCPPELGAGALAAHAGAVVSTRRRRAHGHRLAALPGRSAAPAGRLAQLWRGRVIHAGAHAAARTGLCAAELGIL